MVGGELNVGVRQGRQGEPVVVLVHGITANHVSWGLVADELGDDATIYAPDLRGRAGSGALPGPYGIANHAHDIVAILDHFDAEVATLAGHSMGGFVSCAFSALHPDRLAGHVLVDGGVSLAQVPQGTDIDAILTAMLGPTMQRLSMTFPDVDAWLNFWKAHPSLQDWSPAIEAYVMADLAGVAPKFTSSCNVDAIRADGADTLGQGGQYFRALTRPTPWLRAPRGLLNAEPLYTDEAAAQMCTEVPALQDQLVDDVNHFTIAISERGAKITADVIRSQLP